jgi:hypothetical protein
MGLEKRTYGRSTKQTLGDIVKGAALVGLGVGMMYMSKEVHRSIHENDQHIPYSQPSANLRTATLDEFEDIMENTMGVAIPYGVGAFGILTIIGGAARITNRRYRF